MEAILRAFGDTHAAALTLGASTVVLTHTYMLLAPEEDMADAHMIRNHALLNLAAGAAVVYGARLLG